jgi:hypothetical protein
LLFCEEASINPDAYIQVDSTKLYLRHSNKNDVEKIFGEPEEIQYFEHGGEDFYWDNFTVSFYNDRKLFFHFNSEENIIRITVYSSSSRPVRLKYGPIVTLTKNDIKKILRKNISYESDRYLIYREDISFSTIVYAYRFDEYEKIIWYDMYYEKPWD